MQASKFRGCFTEHIERYEMYFWVVYQRGKWNDTHSWAELPSAALTWKVSDMGLRSQETSQKVLKFESLRWYQYFWPCFHQAVPAEQILALIFKVQQSYNSCCSWWRYSAACSEGSSLSLSCGFWWHLDKLFGTGLYNSPEVTEGAYSNCTWVPSLTNLCTFITCPKLVATENLENNHYFFGNLFFLLSMWVFPGFFCLCVIS